MNKYIIIFAITMILFIGCDNASRIAKHKRNREYLIEKRLEVLEEVKVLNILLEQCTTNDSRVLIMQRITTLIKHAEYLRDCTNGRNYF